MLESPNFDFQKIRFQDILQAYQKCRINKRSTLSSIQFEENLEKNIIQLTSDLTSHQYQIKPYSCFAIQDPKLREIWAADFGDRIIHHFLIEYLEKKLEKKFIFHSYACRKNKGALLAVKYLKKHLPFKQYFLKIDVQSFFTSINKNILFSLIKKNISHPEILWLCEKIIFSDPRYNCLIKGDQKLLQSIPLNKSLFHTPANQGLPIGNLTSQFWANLYLNHLDQFIKHKLKCPYYFRYMDDMVFLDDSPTQLLKWEAQVSNFLLNELKLKLHPRKQILQKTKYGVNFLGYIVKPQYILVRKRIILNLKRKLLILNKKIISQKQNVDLDFILKMQASINSYYGHFRAANSYHLRRTIYQKYFKNIKKYLKPFNQNYTHFILKHPPSGRCFKKEFLRDETPLETDTQK